MDDTRNASREPKDRIASDLHALVAHAEDLMKATSSLSGESLTALRSKLGESLDSVRGQLHTFESQTISQGRQALASTDRYVHEKPWQAAALALTLGFLLGTLSTGRH